ncbi:glutathione S-transferase family protein [Propionivibrio soli]|uniref:glutathione S-transferase family protein n=1 Tax=Propionivibrio soli TaxID=2976531 RepID=UPI0021E7D13B|nr:glutathione S-transferase family protein [Propionivibrio soli]
MMKLYGFGPSRWLRVLWAIGELGIDCELVPVKIPAGEHLAPEFLRLNPAHKVPVLVDGDQVITESAAIVLYLAEKYPAKGLLPSDLAQRAQVYRWIFFTMTELDQPLWRIARHSFLYPEDKRSPADIALAREDFADMARVLEKHMIGREFVVGNSITAADCVVAYTVDWAKEFNLLGSLPQLRAYLDRMYARPNAPRRFAAASAGIEAPA